jgi:hypothetical protein
MSVGRSFRIVAGSLALFALLSAGLCGGDGPTGPQVGPDGVASVQMTATISNPRVGQTTIIGATPVGPGGVAVLGIPCVFESKNLAVLMIGVGTGGTFIGAAVGTTNVVATCGSKSNKIAITVRPPAVTFSVTTPGNGFGSVFLNPAGGSYDAGTSVTATATALPGSTFAGWGGACAASGTSSTCTRVLTTSQTATATFTQVPEVFVGQTITNTPLGSATDWAGCQYGISASPVLSASVTNNGAGGIGGTTTGTMNVGIVVTFTPPGNSCFASPFSHNLTGTVSGNNAAVVMTSVSSGGNHYANFTGARSGNTITGTLTIHTLTSDGVSNFPFDKVISPYVLTKTP